MSELLGKAQTIIQQYEDDTEYLKSNFKITDEKTIAFILEYIKLRNATKAYKKIYGSNMASNVAAAAASRKLKKVNFKLSDILEIMGHGETSVVQALDKLKRENVDKYLTHIEKLLQLDVQKVEHSGSISVQFTSDPEEADED